MMIIHILNEDAKHSKYLNYYAIPHPITASCRDASDEDGIHLTECDELKLLASLLVAAHRSIRTKMQYDNGGRQAMTATLCLVLGDQLSPKIAGLRAIDPERDTILLCEVMEEARYVPHHPQKIAFLFSAMRHFAEDLRQKGYRVRYVRLDDPDNTGSFSGEVPAHLPLVISAALSSPSPVNGACFR